MGALLGENDPRSIENTLDYLHKNRSPEHIRQNQNPVHLPVSEVIYSERSTASDCHFFDPVS